MDMTPYDGAHAITVVDFSTELAADVQNVKVQIQERKQISVY